MTDSEILVVDPGVITVLRLDRPRVHNALNAALLEELDAALARAVTTSSVRAVVITGSGDRAFSAGADLDELAGLSSERAHDVLSAGQQVISRVAACPLPVIAAVNGLALGGGFELALAATLPVLAEHATLGLPEAGLGLIPGYGGTQRLVRAVGPRVAAHTMITGQRLTAARAHELGLTPLPPVGDGSVLDVALDVAEEIATCGPRAVRSILTAIRASGDANAEVGLALESALAGLSTGSAEAAEGIAAFREKRRPDFRAVDLGSVNP